MRTKILPPLILTGAAAAAIAFAPTASAGSTADCENAGSTAVCSRPGHAAIVATPSQRTQQVAIIPGNPFGAAAVPPLLALG